MLSKIFRNMSCTERQWKETICLGRTGDLLITNPSLKSPESRHYQKIREFRDKRLRLLGSFRTKCLPAHGLRTDSNFIFRVISHQMFPRKYLTQSKFLERVRFASVSFTGRRKWKNKQSVRGAAITGVRNARRTYGRNYTTAVASVRLF